MANYREKEFGEAMKEKTEEYMQQAQEKARGTISEMEKKLKQGEETFKQIFSNADKQLHENPWPIVTGLALSCLFLGFVIGTSRRND